MVSSEGFAPGSTIGLLTRQPELKFGFLPVFPPISGWWPVQTATQEADRGDADVL